MSSVTSKKITGGFRLTDILVLIFFLFTAVFSINMFRLDLMQTINLRNVEPVGTVVIRKNVVQRRLADRVLWDRLATESPVYLGDLIRVADVSYATLNIDGSSIDLSENTLIRIMKAADGEGLQIIMNEGNLSLKTSQESGRISLEVNGRYVQTGVSGSAVINVEASQDSMVLKVNEGTVHLIEEGQKIEVNTGDKIALDTSSTAMTVKEIRSAAMINPVTNARFVNGGANPLAVNFSWNRNNLKDNELLRLELSSDRNFRQINQVEENLNNSARTELNSGIWYWRLSFENTILDKGHFTITEGAGTQLQSPAANSIFYYEDKLPVLNFKWNEVEEAVSYILEIATTPDFTSAQIRRQCIATSFTVNFLSPEFEDFNFQDGTWYWRVRPVFPSIYIGNASFSGVSNFKVEKRVIAREVSAQTSPLNTIINTPDVSTVRESAVEFSLSEWLFAETAAEKLSEEIPADKIEPVLTVEPVRAAVRRAEPVRVTEPALLPAPVILQPARDRRISMSDLQTQRSIQFSWQAVRGANTYILTLYQLKGNTRNQIFQNQSSALNYSFNNLSLLDSGTFIWQVEAQNRRTDGSINQNGTVSESTFIMDIVLPGRVQIQGAGVLDE